MLVRECLPVGNQGGVSRGSLWQCTFRPVGVRGDVPLPFGEGQVNQKPREENQVCLLVPMPGLYCLRRVADHFKLILKSKLGSLIRCVVGQGPPSLPRALDGIQSTVRLDLMHLAVWQPSFT